MPQMLDHRIVFIQNQTSHIHIKKKESKIGIPTYLPTAEGIRQGSRLSLTRDTDTLSKLCSREEGLEIIDSTYPKFCECIMTLLSGHDGQVAFRNKNGGRLIVTQSMHNFE